MGWIGVLLSFTGRRGGGILVGVDERAKMRAGDADRQSVADRLRQAVDEGRLDLHEYDERLQRAYAARTYGDLDGLLDDLPPVVPASRAQLAPQTPAAAAPAATATAGHHGQRLAPMWGSWLGTSIICTGIWAVSTVGHGWHWHSFWPIWVIGPWGAVLLARTIRGLVDPGYHEEQTRNRADHHAARRARRRPRG